MYREQRRNANSINMFLQKKTKTIFFSLDLKPSPTNFFATFASDISASHSPSVSRDRLKKSIGQKLIGTIFILKFWDKYPP
jgi:hypothetical protein